MDVVFTVRQGEILPQVESFKVLSQDRPCPPQIMSILVSQIHVKLSNDPECREFSFPFRTCPCHVTIDMIPYKTEES